MIGSNLAAEKIPAHSGNYTFGRQGNRILKVTLHHMAARWTARRCGESFQAVGRQGSSHYGIGYDGEIAQYVSEDDTAWADGNWDSNLQSISIECANSSVGGDWPVSDATLKSLSSLLADISRRNGLGKYVLGKNLTWHQMYAATACPGPYMLARMGEIVDSANRVLENPSEPINRTEVKAFYQVHAGAWLPTVSGNNVNDPENGYAGILGSPIDAALANLSYGNLYYKCHVKSGWLPEVKNREDYAGILGTPMDAIMIRSDSTTVHYRVHTREDGWLPAVSGYNESDHENGYAGILGHAIDGLIIWADSIVSEPEPKPEPKPEPEVAPESEPAPVPIDPPAEPQETPSVESNEETMELPEEENKTEKTKGILNAIVRLLEIILSFLKGE